MDPNALSSIGKFSRPLWPPVQDNNPPKDKKLRLLSSITMKKRRPATSIPPPSILSGCITAWYGAAPLLAARPYRGW
ncbi:hypothetical protein DPEC_G00371520 [Dallia pectoralis]|nr:hypothetical protein DPEC_G00371520 [Dallia pectoralis]